MTRSSENQQTGKNLLQNLRRTIFDLTHKTSIPDRPTPEFFERSEKSRNLYTACQNTLLTTEGLFVIPFNDQQQQNNLQSANRFGALFHDLNITFPATSATREELEIRYSSHREHLATLMNQIPKHQQPQPDSEAEDVVDALWSQVAKFGPEAALAMIAYNILQLPDVHRLYNVWDYGHLINEFGVQEYNGKIGKIRTVTPDNRRMMPQKQQKIMNSITFYTLMLPNMYTLLGQQPRSKVVSTLDPRQKQ